jgi:hypothetical protein
MNYGALIDDYKPERDNVYQYFSEYYNNPNMTKVKNEGNLSMYIVKAYCLTSNSCRYLIVFSQIDVNPIGYQTALSNLKWENLQTRTLENAFQNIRMDILAYTPQESGKLTSKINRTKINKEASIYQCEDFPIIVTLLHNNRKSAESYQSRGNVIIALETWETIISWNN